MKFDTWLVLILVVFVSNMASCSDKQLSARLDVIEEKLGISNE